MEEYNAADTEAIKQDNINVKNQRDQELEDIRNILDTPEGRRFFKRFFIEGKMFSTTFTGNSKTFFLEGQRNFALKFFSDICEAAPENIVDVIVEGE